MNLIKKLQYKVDIETLINQTKIILSKYNFNEQNQICFQNTKPNLNDVYEGTGDARLSHCPSYGKPDNDFVYFNKNFIDTIFYDISKNFPGKMRLSVLKSKKCMWMHSDPNLTRYHFAIETNENCFILFKNNKHYHIPVDGHCYEMNANSDHTALNSGKTDRIHLLISKNENYRS